MILTGKVILIISPQAWGINFVSKHHYAYQLAKRGNEVYFLNPESRKDKIKEVKTNLFVVDSKPNFRGLSHMPAFISAWLIKYQIERFERIFNTNFDIIWNFDSSSFFNLRYLKSKLRISHIVDYSENKNLKLLNTSADVCLSSSNYIVERQRQYNRNAYNIGHGYAPPRHIEPVTLPISRNIQVGYLGNLLIKYLDWELLFNLVNKYPDVSFFFAGPDAQGNLNRIKNEPKFLNESKNKKNSFFLGPIKPGQIQSFLSQIDVLLLVYKSKNDKEQLANPHKLLEYLGSGKVIVASWTDEYKDKRYLLEMVEKNKDLPSKFNKVLGNLGHYNSPEKQAARKDWAMENTYERQIERIERLID